MITVESPPEAEPRLPPAGVLARALLVLNCFTEAQPRLHLREIAAATGLDKATLLRMLGTFVAGNYVQRLEDGRYAPGAAVLRLSSVYHAVSDVSARLTSVLRLVVDQANESAAFYKRSGDDRVCVARVNANRPVRHQVEVGHGVPLVQGGAAAHVLLAFTGGRSDKSDAVLMHGFATTAAEREPDLASVAVPVFEADGTFLGALVVSSPLSRQSTEAWQRACQIAMQALTMQGFCAKRPEPVAVCPPTPANGILRRV